MNANLQSRLDNWKFKQALQYLKGEDARTNEVVGALSAMFGDVGWGLGGSMGIVVDAALSSLQNTTPKETKNP